MNEETPISLSEQAGSPEHSFRCGYVAIIGRPNVGKSTLMNALVGQKISIVTRKPQTTRHKISGILSTESSQIIFLDTPGLIQPEYPLHDAMMDAARSAIDDADVVLYMIDATSPGIPGERADDPSFDILKHCRTSVFLVINKLDLVKPQTILPVIAAYAEKFPFKEIFPVSALKLAGTKDLLAGLVAELPVHAPYYPTDSVSEHSERFFVAELIREKIFEKFRDEIPYSTAVQIADFREKEGRKDVIQAEIYVERESQKGILIGKDGAALKEVGESARKEIEIFLERPVYLELQVKVGEQWRKKKEWLRRFGYR